MPQGLLPHPQAIVAATWVGPEKMTHPLRVVYAPGCVRKEGKDDQATAGTSRTHRGVGGSGAAHRWGNSAVGRYGDD